MSVDTIEQCVKKYRLKYYKYGEFNKIEEIGGGLAGKAYKANWKQNGKYLMLKSFSFDNVKEIINEIKLYHEIDRNDTMMKFCGITKTDSDKYLLVKEYAEGGTLRNYLEVKFLSLNWEDKCGLAFQLSGAINYLHENGIVHIELNSNNVYIHQNSIKLADFGLDRRIKDAGQISLDIFDTIPYIDPEVFGIIRENSRYLNSLEEDERIEKLKKSDIFSVGVLLWELSSGKKPFSDTKYDLSLADRIARGLREKTVDKTPEEYSDLYSRCWCYDQDKRPTIQEVAYTLTSMVSQQIIQSLKLNHGLFLNGHKIEPSKRAVLFGDGVLNMNLYDGQPIVYTFINDHDSRVNFLSYNSNNNEVELDEALQPSDICINFPIGEITYTADLSKSFLNFTDDEGALNEMYGHLFAKKVLIGGKIFIDDFKPDDTKEANIFKSFLTVAYDSAKYDKKNPFNNLSPPNFFPKIRASDGVDLSVPYKLANWMNNLYQKKTPNIISYNDLIPISELRSSTTSSSTDEKQPGIANFKKRLSLKEWVGDPIYANITKWIKEFRLLQGLIVNKYFELENSKKLAIDLVNIPEIYSIDKSYLNIMKPTTNLEEFLIINNIRSFSKTIESDDKSCEARTLYLSTNLKEVLRPINMYLGSPFSTNKKAIRFKHSNYGDYTHFIMKYEKYEISLSKDDINPSEELNQAIEKALEDMKPLIFLKDVFDEYGHFFPLSIILGKSFKNILPNSSLSITFENIEKIDLGSPRFESLKLSLEKSNSSYFLPRKGNIVKISDFPNWTQNMDNDLEIIEFDKIIPLYEILEAGQQKKIDYILNERDNFKIILTGLVDLKNFDTNAVNVKRININPTFEDENYKVFGSIISKKSLSRIDEFSVTFESYDFSGFSAIINKLSETIVNIKGCYILWIIIGNPSSLSVFSPKNRNFNVDSFSITLQSNLSDYRIAIPFSLSQGDSIFINSRSNFEPNNGIKLINWSYNSIKIEMIKPIINFDESGDDNSALSVNFNNQDYEIDIFRVPSNYKNLKIDNENEDEVSIGSIGYNLTKENFVKELMMIVPFTIPFTKFLPLIDEIRNILNDVIDIAQKAEYNTRICNALKQRVYAVDLAVLDLKVQRNNQEYFNGNNYLHLQNLITIITNIKKFMKNISQILELLKTKYILPKNIEKALKELCDDFDFCIIKIDASDFTTTIKDKIRSEEEEEEQLKADQEDLNKYFGQIVGVNDKDKEEMILKINKINIMKSTMEKLLDKQVGNENNKRKYQLKIDEIFQAHQLSFSDYVKTDKKPRKNGKVTEWVDINNNDERAFKSISEEDKISVQNQVIILRELHDWQNIIKFYGLTYDGSKWYLVTEWAEHGNLREFYTNNENSFDPKLKLSISLDIARGLNFLRTVEILHRDIRAENVLITHDNKAKLTNFKLSRSYNAATQNQQHNSEQIRYCAPEILNRTNGFKYNNKCEVYSFGILLWEISEEKVPYKNMDDFVDITNYVLGKNRENFSENNQMPDEFKNLVLDAVNHDPESRPKLTTMFIVLSNCLESFDSHTSLFKYTTHAEAAKKHEMFGLITEIRDLFDKIGEITQAAEHNKRICKALKQRVYVVYLAIVDRKVHGNDKECFNENYRQCLQDLVAVIKKIKEFVANVSQMTTLLELNYNQSDNIEKIFKELCSEFDNCVNSPNFTTTVKSKKHLEEDDEALKADQDELNKYFKNVEIGVDNDDNKNKLLKVNKMNNKMERFLDEQMENENNKKIYQTSQTKIDEIFQAHQLVSSDYAKIDMEPRKGGNVTKWVNVKNKDIEYAFKSISEKDINSVQNQVTILKELHDWRNIIKFYGLTRSGDKWYLVTEWAEHGNLREFYTKNSFDPRLKLCISLDIARGLNFLRTVEILHRDIRAENVLITHDNTAKLTNFKLSRSYNADTLNQHHNLEQIRYCAPEILERTPGFKYNNKCEVYSFGILLWEISEEKIPYENLDDFVEVTKLVLDKYREPFSENSQMPNEFKNIALDAVNHDPEFRPKISTMFEILNKCLEAFKTHSHTPLQDRKHVLTKNVPKLPDFESFNYMTLAEAAKQHKKLDKKGKPSGDMKTAYKCFEAYANSNTTIRNQIMAKYYKALYISKGYVESTPDKDKIVAELFKEVADDEANEFPDAKLRYGTCLYNGKGVEKNLSEALKYFEQTAESGYMVAMYNAGKLYYEGGDGVEKDLGKASYYMRLANYHEYEPATKFCKQHNISL
ncbi:hypothetical protein RclHR1_10080003 [Rhizophagus clarus]|uniref:Kinase-like domain-containing protein n=1 Tax=Rhizophagus clarus TaxID=94130 RepID=A0A2Z6Q0P2_9GLOM|nr:hypothetical protein RclHR1_10080003 [Rhizophagus clarus]GES99748.1 kinase-like domain-containing protein [Rhizophagus clarus]